MHQLRSFGEPRPSLRSGQVGSPQDDKLRKLQLRKPRSEHRPFQGKQECLCDQLQIVRAAGEDLCGVAGIAAAIPSEERARGVAGRPRQAMASNFLRNTLQPTLSPCSGSQSAERNGASKPVSRATCPITSIKPQEKPRAEASEAEILLFVYRPATHLLKKAGS